MLIEQDTLEHILSQYADRGRDALLPILHDVQAAYGYIDENAVYLISHTLKVPEADIYGVITFYTLFHTTPTAKRIVRVCNSPVCHARGASDLTVEFIRMDDDITVETTECIGLCDLAPAILMSERGTGETLHGNVTDAADFLNDPAQFGHDSPAFSALKILLHNHPDGRETFEGVKNALTTLTPDKIISQIEDSGLIGRGGAAFPTGLKFKLARNAPGDEKYVVCNADESEPGTFKDRHLLCHYPFDVLAGMILTGYAIGAERGYVFIRGEYPHAMQVLETAIHDAMQRNWLGDHIMGSDFSFHVEIRRGAGAYICGEETALFEAIEGKRGFPRIKPPYPTTDGLFGKPTACNNVETLCNLPLILRHGPEQYRQYGTEKTTGTRLVSVSGDVQQPGVYEIEPGIPLQDFLENQCQGITGTLQAVLMGGAAGTFLLPDELDIPLTFETLRATGNTFGSGAIMVFNQDVDLRQILQRLGHFFQHESCGKCLPCQLGTQRQVEILEHLDSSHSRDHQRLIDIGQTMMEASICGLGQTASTAVLSAIEKFPHLFTS